MSTRSTTHFVAQGKTQAIVYRHSDGYPEGHGCDLADFFDAVESQTDDHRYNDPSYLAAKLVVWLADKFASTYTRGDDGEWGYVKNEPLDFLSVGICMEDPGDIEFLYEIVCAPINSGERPEVICYKISHGGGWDKPATKGNEVPIPARADA